MPAVALLMLQVAGTIGPSASSVLPAGSLLRPVPSQSCSTKADEIVVCGKDADSYRLPAATGEPEASGPPKAEWKLFGQTRMGVNASERGVGGYSAPAAMVTIKVPF